MSASTTTVTSSYSVAKKKSQWKTIWIRFKKNKMALGGLIVFLLMAVIVLSADLWLDYEKGAMTMDIANAYQSPSAQHIFGTDQYGRDYFTRVVYGGRISMFVGIATVMVSLIFGGLIGATAAYYGGKVDEVLMRCMDVLLAIPSILLATAIVAALGPSLPNVVIAIGLANIPQFARIVRASVLTIKGQEYIEAARAMGASDLRIIAKYIIPNSMAPLIVQGSVGVAIAILSIASLSFVGLGVQPPTPEWGAMLSNARTYMRDAWHITVMPGAAIMLSILSLNIIGDGLRDALDPRLKN